MKHTYPEEYDNTDDDEAANESECSCNQRTVPCVGVSPVDMFDDLGHRERHDGDRTDGDVLGGSEELERSEQ